MRCVGDLVRLIPRLNYAILFTLSDPRDTGGGVKMVGGDLGIITEVDPAGLRDRILIARGGDSFTGYVHPDWVELVSKKK